MLFSVVNDAWQNREISRNGRLFDYYVIIGGKHFSRVVTCTRVHVLSGITFRLLIRGVCLLSMQSDEVLGRFQLVKLEEYLLKFVLDASWNLLNRKVKGRVAFIRHISKLELKIWLIFGVLVERGVVI